MLHLSIIELGGECSHFTIENKHNMILIGNSSL